MSGSIMICKSPLAVLLADEFRRGWWKLACAQTAGLGTAAIVYASLQRAGAIDPQAGRTVHFVLLWIVYAAAAAAALLVSGDPARLYLLPLSNRLIAALTLFPGMIYVGLIYLATAVALGAIFVAGWPVWGPALFLAAAWGVMKALSLAAGESHLLRLTCWCAAAILLQSWLCQRYGGGSLLQPRALWLNVTIGELIAMSLIIVGAYLLGVRSISRARRGDPAILSNFSWRSALTQRFLRVRDVPFRDRGRAQFWFEWRQKGLILPALFAVFATLLLTGFFLKQYDKGTYELLHASFGFGTGLGPVALIVGLVVGHLDLAGANPECGSFLATRPASNAALSGALLKASAASLFIAWGMWCSAMIGSTVILDFDQGREPVLDLWTLHGKSSEALSTLGFAYAVLLFAIVLLAAWVPLSLAASLVLTGRPRLLVGFVTGGIPVLLLAMFLAEQSASGQSVWPAAALHYVIGISSLAGTGWVWLAAVRRAQVSTTSLGLALAGWFALCGCGAGIYFLTGPLEAAHLVLLAGLLALPFAACAAAPLALAWNRHR